MELGARDDTGTTDRLRAELVEVLRNQQLLRSASIERAVGSVPRHLFLPDTSIEQAYANEPVVLKRDDDGKAIGSASQPGVITTMLEQANVLPGQRVLEIGAGTGYNAALLAHLVGPGGEVTTVDVDEKFVEHVGRGLAAAGVSNVRVIHGDGEFGAADHAPYDRVIVTVGAWDVAPAWLDQLADDGRIVVPLRLPSWSFSISFDRADGFLLSRSIETCGFVPMRGAGANDVVGLDAAAGVRLWFDDGQPVDADLAGSLLHQPRAEVWADAKCEGVQRVDTLQLWLASRAERSCKFFAEPAARESDLVAPLAPWGGVWVFYRDTIAYVTSRRLESSGSGARPVRQLGARAHGPAAAEVAERVAEQIDVWDRELRTAFPRIELHPSGTPNDRLGTSYIVEKRHTRLVISWPDLGSTSPTDL